MVEFEVEILKNDGSEKAVNSRYSAYWDKNKRYHAEGLRIELKIGKDLYEYTSGCTTLDGVIAEAEHNLLHYKCGCAAIYDGKYRVAVVKLKYGDKYADSELTKYGTKCSDNEHN